MSTDIRNCRFYKGFLLADRDLEPGQKPMSAQQLCGRYCEHRARRMAKHTLRRAAADRIKYAVVAGGRHANKVRVIFDRGIQDYLHYVAIPNRD